MENSPTNIVTIDDFKVTNLAEFQGKKEQQEQIVNNNPFTAITDTETYETAKKHRTTLVSARTSLDKEKKAVAKRIKEVIVDGANKAYDELIAITTPHEEKQQEEVKRYEAKKEEERLEKERKAKERVDGILRNIDLVVYIITNEINSLCYNTSLTYSIKPMLEGKEVTKDDFEEYGSKFVSEIEALEFKLQQRKSLLAAEEKNRLEAIELEKQREEQNRKDAIKSAIFNFNSKWQHTIANLQENQIEKTVEDFNSLVDEDYQEFQQEYQTTKQQVSLALNNRIAQIQQQIELDKQKAESEKQQKEMLVLQRRGYLAILGFDYNTLTYNQNGLELQVIESDLTQNQFAFNELVDSIQERIKTATQPVAEETSQPIPEQPIQEPVKTEHPITEAVKYSKNQLRSIDFLKGFIQYSEQNLSCPVDVNIMNYVLLNVK